MYGYRNSILNITTIFAIISILSLVFFTVLVFFTDLNQNLPESTAEIESKLILQKKEAFYRNWLNNLRNHFSVKVDQEIYENWGTYK